MNNVVAARKVETKEELITRLLAKADLAYKCCGFAPPGSKR
jgi:hypothetical protein